MTTEELESKLEAAVETPTLDFKAACDWNVVSLAKDLLAMSNVQDGGHIIVGVEDGTFARQGITAEQRDTYDIDVMRDQMASYADPHVNFTVEFPRDLLGKDYAVIRVLPFEEIPVICRRDSKDTRAIYYRNKSARVNSGAVCSSYDMRDIITIATVRMIQRRTEVGLIGQPQVSKENQVKKRLDEELGGL